MKNALSVAALSFTSVVMLLIVGLWYVKFRSWSEIADHTALPSSMGSIDTVLLHKGIGIQSMIIVLNPRLSHSAIVASFGDEEDVAVDIAGLKDITLSMPNLVDLSFRRSEIDGYNIKYIFLPKDDPRSRNLYRRALHNRNDKEAQDWFKANILGPMNAKKH